MNVLLPLERWLALLVILNKVIWIQTTWRLAVVCPCCWTEDVKAAVNLEKEKKEKGILCVNNQVKLRSVSLVFVMYVVDCLSVDAGLNTGWKHQQLHEMLFDYWSAVIKEVIRSSSQHHSVDTMLQFKSDIQGFVEVKVLQRVKRLILILIYNNTS